MGEHDVHVGTRQLGLEAGDRRRQCHQAEPRGVKAMRKVAKVFADRVHAGERLRGERLPLAVNEPPEDAEIDLQDGEPLADVVVQLPRDSRTLVLLCAQEACA